MPPKPRVFISYARSDGLDFARRLRAWLEEKGIPLFQDLVSLGGGEDFLLQIYKAIDQVKFLTLLMTPNALASENVKKEWRYARQRGVCVFPVVVPKNNVDYEGLPHWMSSSNWYDLNYEEQWTKLLNDLSRTCVTPRVPFMVEDLPENFVERPAEFDSLVSLLRDPKREEPIAMTAALRGAGGFGKTTLARALCHNECIQEAFDDGILWVTLGESPGDLKLKVLDFVEVLSGERPAFDSAEAATTRLAELLADRDILMVVDDVWAAVHLAPFLRDPKEKGRRRCARLITTRNRDTVPDQARTVDVDAMRPNEAVKLLAAGLPAGHNAELGALARRLGKWPVLLNLANGVLRDRVGASEPLGEAIEVVNADLDENGLAALDKPFDATDPRQRERAVTATLGVSLKRLDDPDRARYQELAVFPENADIPLSTLERLWGQTGSLSRVSVQKLCERLSGLSLLLRLDLNTRTIRLHEVMRSYLARGMKDSVALHAVLLAGWGDPYHLPDNYSWHWYTYHLKQAGRDHELCQLLRILWDPLWMFSKLAATDVNALIADYEHLKPSPEGELLQGALRLSAHVLAADAGQFASQMAGRLLPHRDSAGIQRFIGGLAATAPARWLRPLHPALHPPGTGLVRTLAGHSDYVSGVAVTPDGKRAVSASDDQTLKVWDLETGGILRTLEGHSSYVSGVAVTPDGKRAVSASWDKTLKVWDLETGGILRTLEGHSSYVSGVAVTPDGKRAVSASGDNTLKVWDLETGGILRTLAGHSSLVLGVAVTRDGKRAVSASYDNTLKVWDLETGGILRTLEGHSDYVYAVAVTPDGKRAVSASGDHTLKVWDLETGGILRTLEGHSYSVHGVAVTPDGKRAVSASNDKTLKVWDLETGGILRTLEGHSSSARAVAVTPDGKRAVSASNDKTLKVWDLETGGILRTLEGHSLLVLGVAVTPDGKRAVSASGDNTLKVWDLETGGILRTLEGHSSYVRGVAVTPDGKRAVSASNDKTLKVWDLETGGILRTLEGHSSSVRAVAVTSDGKRAVSASNDKTLKVWDLETGGILRTLEGHSSSVRAVAVTPDGKRAVSASEDKTLKVWDLETGGILRTLEGHSYSVHGVAVTPDGKRAVSASEDKTLKVWDLETGGILRTLEGHSASVSGVAVTPDGKRAVSASGDKTLKVWDIVESVPQSKTGLPLATFTCDAALDCVFASRQMIVAGDVGGRLHFLLLEERMPTDTQTAIMDR